MSKTEIDTDNRTRSISLKKRLANAKILSKRQVNRAKFMLGFLAFGLCSMLTLQFASEKLFVNADIVEGDFSFGGQLYTFKEEHIFERGQVV